MRGGFSPNGRLYPSFRIDTTLRLEPFWAHTCQKFCSRAPTGRHSTTLRTFVTGGAEGDRFTEKASFTGFIRPFSEITLGLTPFFCGGLSKTQKVQELQHLCNLHFDSSQEHLKHTEHLASFKQAEQCFKGPGFEQNLHSNCHFLLFPLKALGLRPPEEAPLPQPLMLRLLPKVCQAGTSVS